MRCGGNTPCLEVRCGSRLIVLDAGTGIRELGLKLEQEGAAEFDLLITHSHMDHLQGFPFFNPAYNERCREIAREMFYIMSEVRKGLDEAQPASRLTAKSRY